MIDKISSGGLEGLFINNNGLEELRMHLSKFNPIRVMQMENMEIRHSTILAWLLSPQETHGFGDLFLKAFLSEALRGRRGEGISAIDVHLADLSDADIRREWLNIDIFIKSEKNKWAFIVENKVRSKQHSGQLAKYKTIIENLFHERLSQIQGLFLTLEEEPPEDESYAQIYYSDIRRVLSQLVERKQPSLDDKVLYFLKFYIDTLDLLTGESLMQQHMISLARQLYRENKTVLDFIYEHGIATDFNLATQSLFGEDLDYLKPFCKGKYLYNWQNNKRFSFIPAKWIDVIGGKDIEWIGCENWWAGFPLILWFSLNTSGDPATLKLYAEVGPLTNHEQRTSLIMAIENSGCEYVKFSSSAMAESAKYSRFLKGNSVKIEDSQDVEELKKKIEQLLSKYEPDFEKITDKLKEWYESL